MTSGFTRGCPICGSVDRTETIGTKVGFNWGRCGRCDLRYVDLGADVDLRDHYEDYYGDHSPVVPPSIRTRISQLVRSFEPYRSRNRVLDVGFGAGWLLRAASDQNWSCWGTEVVAESIETARSAGWRVFEGDLTDAKFPANHFDVITFVEVLEHLADPLAYLKEAARVLRPGGLLYGTTPNARGANARILGLDWSIYTPPEHLQLFTPRALRKAVGSAGLDLVQTRTEGLNPIELTAARRRQTTPINRVEIGYVLNERLVGSRFGGAVKTTANRLLSWTRLGDSLKFYALRPTGQRARGGDSVHG